MYRIYTQNVYQWDIIALLDAHLEGYTLIEARGRYKGESEQSLIIEIFEPVSWELIRNIAKQIKNINQQDSVAIVRIPGQPDFV